MKNKTYFYIGSSAFILSIFLIAAMLYKNQQRKVTENLINSKKEILERSYAPTIGSNKPKVTITEFLDPECETCRVFYPEVKKILKTYEGKIKLIVRYAPFHENSQIAIRALEAARMQDMYWRAIEELFKYQPQWGSHHDPKPEMIFVILNSLGIDMEKLKDDMLNDKIDQIIKQDMIDLKQLNVKKTPTFFVNGKRLEQFGLKNLIDLIDSEINK